MAKLIDLQVLDNFKLRQDAANDAFFIKRSNITVDSSSKNVKIAVNESGTPLQVLTPDSTLSATKVSGVLSLDNIPVGAKERMVIVETEAARLALTKTSNPAVENGDVVKVNATGKMYYVKDDTRLKSEAAFEVFRAGYAQSAQYVPWSGVENKPTSVGNTTTPVYIKSNGDPEVCNVVIGIGASSSGDTCKLIIKTSSNPTGSGNTLTAYQHPAEDGDKHVPTGGATGKFVTYDSSKTGNKHLVWHTVTIPTSQPSDVTAGSIWIEQ